MAFLDFPRVPEAEVMDDSGEVEAYASAAAQAHLDKIDNTLIEHALRLVQGSSQGRALDIGTGPGQIVIKLARRLPGWNLRGVDRSPGMIRQAQANLRAAAGELGGRVRFELADGNRLSFAEKSFELVMCNSVLHHLSEPANLLSEMARLATEDGAILLRDLRRPGRLAYPLYVRWHGRNYSGEMLRLYRDSVRAAYTVPELEELLRSSAISGARVFQHGSTHLGVERAAKAPVRGTRASPAGSPPLNR
ncbi:MAG: class I SAM-dependent methyltransferase [Candidatus Acidiferrales bacterium]